jgi:hypothetical protein
VDPATERRLLAAWDVLTGSRGVPNPNDKPEDAAASKLLEAAGDLIARNDFTRGERVLKLVATEFRGTAEAALARTALRNLPKYR